MKSAEIERRVLHLWTTTNVPLTSANIQAYTGATRAEVTKTLDAMVAEQVVELDSDADGNLLYVVSGSARIPRGASTVGEVMKLDQLRNEVPRGSTALARTGGDSNEKSLVVSGLLSFFLGPFGLLYAAPVVEAVVSIAVLIAVSMVLPQSIVSAILGVSLPLFGAAGVVYAARHNKNGRRTTLLPAAKPVKRLR